MWVFRGPITKVKTLTFFCVGSPGENVTKLGTILPLSCHAFECTPLEGDMSVQPPRGVGTWGRFWYRNRNPFPTWLTWCSPVISVVFFMLPGTFHFKQVVQKPRDRNPFSTWQKGSGSGLAESPFEYAQQGEAHHFSAHDFEKRANLPHVQCSI